MRVSLFRTFPDQYRFSMSKYADELHMRVGEYMKPGETIEQLAFPAPRLEGLGRYWDQYVRYGRFAAAHAGDVNHIVDNGFAHLATRLPRGRTIVTFHDAVVAKVPGVRWTTKAAFNHCVRSLRYAAAIVCDSESAKRDLLELAQFPEEKLHVIPIGIDESFRPPGDREVLRRRLGFSGNVVLMVGHTQGYMNVERMLRAVATLIARHGIDVTLAKIGLPFTPDQMRLIAELELGERIEIIGRVPSSDVPAYYQAADVLFYAPLLAGFGLPPLEAMACGTPVVASNRGSIPEICGDAAILADADDEGALAVALADVLTDPARHRRLVDAGFERAARFEWSVSARRFLELYRHIGRA